MTQHAEDTSLVRNVKHISENTEKHRIIHVNCTVDKYYPLCNKNFPKLEYIGYAKTKDTALKARERYNNPFYHRNYKTLNKVLLMTTDILLVSVSKNPIEVLNSILPLDIPHVIVPKIKVSQKDERQLFDTIIKNGYDYVFQFVDIKEDVLTLILENILQKKHNDKLI